MPAKVSVKSRSQPELGNLSKSCAVPAVEAAFHVHHVNVDAAGKKAKKGRHMIVRSQWPFGGTKFASRIANCAYEHNGLLPVRRHPVRKEEQLK